MRMTLLVVSLALLMSLGCRKKSSAVIPTAEPMPSNNAESAPPAVTPKPIVTAPLESAPIAKTITAPSLLELGVMNFRLGKYPQAAKALDEFVSGNPQSKDRDQALFFLGLSRALANDSSRDLRQAEAAFKRLIAEYPTSPYKTQVEFILNLQGQIDKLRSDVKERDDKIKKLSEELQVLKEIDLQRRPSRPPE